MRLDGRLEVAQLALLRILARKKRQVRLLLGHLLFGQESRRMASKQDVVFLECIEPGKHSLEARVRRVAWSLGNRHLKDDKMGQYKRKPVVIEAVQWLNRKIICPPGPMWFCEAEESKRINLCGDCLLIETLEGTMTARPGDWIILGVKGEIYPCKPDVFAATYEEVVTPIPTKNPTNCRDTSKRRRQKRLSQHG